jgi:hypothetical protein
MLYILRCKDKEKKSCGVFDKAIGATLQHLEVIIEEKRW